jgi:predicted DNA-binding transcriptional regulator AlpA
MLFSTYQAAKKLGISIPNLYRYVEQGKLPAPKAVRVGNRNVRWWTEADIDRVRKLLPKIANGRKTRYKKHSAVSTQKKHSALSSQQRQKPKAAAKARRRTHNKRAAPGA